MGHLSDTQLLVVLNAATAVISALAFVALSVAPSLGW
jgi:hypothetical protein